MQRTELVEDHDGADEEEALDVEKGLSDGPTGQEGGCCLSLPSSSMKGSEETTRRNEIRQVGGDAAMVSERESFSQDPGARCKEGVGGRRGLTGQRIRQVYGAALGARVPGGSFLAGLAAAEK